MVGDGIALEIDLPFPPCFDHWLAGGPPDRKQAAHREVRGDPVEFQHGKAGARFNSSDESPIRSWLRRSA